MLKLKLVRYDYGLDYTIGELYVNDKYFCDTLEDAVRPKKIYAETAIPSGVYTLSKRFSPHFKRELIWLLNVTGFEFILIHSGNTKKDTKGCILVGKGIGMIGKDKAVLNSKTTEQELNKIVFDYMAKNPKQKISIEIIDTKKS